MGASTFQFSFENIGFDVNDVYRMLRMNKEDALEPYPTIIDNEISHLKDKFNIQGGYLILDKIEVQAETIRINDTIFNVGKNLSSYLKKAEKIALFVCTVGSNVSQRSKQLTNEGELLESYITDVIGTVAVESAMDHIYRVLNEVQNKENYKLSNRYSPGYCNWDVSEQHKLFSFFPQKFCGVSLSENALMHPIKSVSGLIGLGTNIKKLPYLCSNCTSTSCIYRKVKKQK